MQNRLKRMPQQAQNTRKTMKNEWNWMSDEEREEAEERAAIMHYHGAISQERAEFWAVDRILKRREQRRTPVRADIDQTSFYL